MTKFCTNCGNELDEKDKVCGNCGTAVDGDSKNEVENSNNVNNNNVNYNYSQPVQQKQTNGMAIAGFVVSLVSTLLCCGAFNVISLVLSIVGLVQAKKINGSGKGLAIAGIIISALFLVISLILTVLGVFGSLVDEIMY